MTNDASTVTKGITKLVAKSRGGMAGCTARLGALRAKVSAGIHPSELLLLILTALDITERPLISYSPAYFPAMRDPGALDSNGKPTNPRYQPDAGRSALRSHGVPHPSAGTPVGDFLRKKRAVHRAANPKQRAAHGPPAVPCPAGVPFPEPRPPKPPAPRRSAAKKRKKRFADVDYGRPYTTKRR